MREDDTLPVMVAATEMPAAMPIAAPIATSAASEDRFHRAQDRRGSAMVVGLFLITTAAFLILALLTTAVDSARWTAEEADEYRLEAAAESAVALAVHQLWGSFEAQEADEITTPWDFRAYLDALGVADQRGVAGPVKTDLLPVVGLPAAQPGADGMTGVRVEALDMFRVDVVEGTRIVFNVTVSTQRGQGARRRSIRQAYRVERAEWEGLDFAMLANNINCIVCHANVDSAARFYNTNPALYGTFERVKVGSLESLQLRDSVDSSIAGTLYLKGRAYTDLGAAIDDWPTRDFKSRQFDAEGRLQQDGTGAAVIADFRPADTTAPQPHENLYLDYDEDSYPLVDGYMPQSFPAVFPDDGGVDPLTGIAAVPGDAGNRLVDPSEFDAATGDASGTLAGGRIHVADPSDPIDSGSELTAALATSNAASLGPVTQGNVFLIGTLDDPILLNGEIAIQGNVVIDGWVKGSGTLLVSGNVYIPSDLAYLDGTDGAGNRTFGAALDGTVNALAIASGGNIMVGDIFHPRWGTGNVTGDTDGSFSFILDELAIFNRAEWTKTQPMLPSRADDRGDPTTWSVTNPLYEGPGYLPRYYRFTDRSKLPIFLDGWFDPVSQSWHGREHPAQWGTDRLLYAEPENASDPVLYEPDGTPKAAVYKLTANGNWISDAVLRDLMRGRLAVRDERDPLRIEAVLYSNNSIFGIIPRATRASGLDGQVVLSGGIIAADIGLLSPTRIEIRYDPRAKGLIDIPSETRLTIRRELWAPLPVRM